MPWCFLYRKVLKLNLGEEINAVRANKKLNISAAMTREETARVCSLMRHASAYRQTAVRERVAHFGSDSVANQGY